MKEFKVNEKSRFLDKKVMATIEGGWSCIGAIYTICQPGATDTFQTNPLCGTKLYGTCGVGLLYKATEYCNNINSVSCGTEQLYVGPVPNPLP